MTSFHFLHSADIHLDSPLTGLSGQEGGAVERVRTATRDALRELVSLAIDERVDFLIIAGDLYDGDWRDYRTGLYFISQMGRLNEVGIHVYLLFGNHDAESQITRRLDLPENVHVFGSRAPETLELADLRVALHGQSYRQRAETSNLVSGYPAPVPDAFNIGVLHTGLGGMGGHANYAPCALDDLINMGYDYWALGHVHRREVLHQQPHIVFPGNLQGRNVRETGPKGAILVTVEDNEILDCAHVPCDVVRWDVLRVPLRGVDRFDTVIDRVRSALDTAVSEDGDGKLLACRVVLEDQTNVHSELLASEDRILNEIRAIALGLGDEVAWVEKIVIQTEAVEAVSSRMSVDGMDDLKPLFRTAASDDGLISEFQQKIGKFVRRLPHEVRAEVEDEILQSAIEGDWNTLIDRAVPHMLARLTERKD